MTLINFSCFSLFPKASTGWIQTKAVITTQNTCTAISKEEPLVFFQITKRLDLLRLCLSFTALHHCKLLSGALDVVAFVVKNVLQLNVVHTLS